MRSEGLQVDGMHPHTLWFIFISIFMCFFFALESSFQKPLEVDMSR